MPRAISLSENIGPILGAIRTVPIPVHERDSSPPPATPFITLSRQPGAGAWRLAQEFVEAINAARPGDAPWTCWDRELVEKVAADHKLSAQLVEAMEEGSHTWLGDFLSGLSFGDAQEEMKAYRGVATTIRALAQAGRVVLVGRGARFITRGMSGGIHVRLVAPLQKRIEYIGESMRLPSDEAARWIADAEKRRAAFYKRYWPKETLEPERFALTINTAECEPATMIALLRELVEQRMNARH